MINGPPLLKSYGATRSWHQASCSIKKCHPNCA